MNRLNSIPMLIILYVLMASSVIFVSFNIQKTGRAPFPDSMEFTDICTAEELFAISDNLAGNYKLICDIDFSETDFEPLGEFSGYFDGNGHTISYIKFEGNYLPYDVERCSILSTDHPVGLFSKNNGIIHNLTVLHADLITNLGNLGILAGLNTGNISNCHVEGKLNGSYRVGGLVGDNRGKIIASTANIQISPYQDLAFGNGKAIGGLVGYNIYGSINRSYSRGSITGTLLTDSELRAPDVPDYCGYRVPFLYSIKPSEYVGGLVGVNYDSMVDNSYSNVSIESTNYSIGGLVGTNYGTSIISNSLSIGKVEGMEEVGGLVGSLKFTRRIRPGQTINSFWSPELSGQSTSAGGDQKSVTELEQVSTYEGWESDTIWKLEEGRLPNLLAVTTDSTKSETPPPGIEDVPVPPSQSDQVLVVYNENHPDAQEIAEYYADKRNIDESHLCPIKIQTGQYAEYKYLLGARKNILDNCICPLISPDCTSDQLDLITENTPIKYLAIIRGIPPRVTGVPWTALCIGCVNPAANEDPSFDFYLAGMLYREIDLDYDKPGVYHVTKIDGKDNPFLGDGITQPFNPMFSYIRNIDPSIDKLVAYSRIEAMDKERTLELIDRTISAEQNGIEGNFFTEKTVRTISEPLDDTLYSFLREATSEFSDSCIATIGSGSAWDHECRLAVSYNGNIPGEKSSNIKKPLDAGLFLGYNFKPNGHRGFDKFDNMLNWRVTDSDCIPLCKDCDGISCEENTCRENSKDYFKEINSDCVGVAPGFMGWQYRSWPVQYFGFWPPGWTHVGGGNGAYDKMPPSILSGDSYKKDFFTDDKYLHYGASTSTMDCDTETGTETCKEMITVHLKHLIDVPNELLDPEKTYIIRFRHKNPANPGGHIYARIYPYLLNTEGEERQGSPSGSGVSLEEENLDWRTSEIQSTLKPYEDYNELNRLYVYIYSYINHNVKDWFELDGVEIIDMDTGQNILPKEIGSFNETPVGYTTSGDWASNIIARLGGIASWGSSSHYMTGGHAFSDASSFVGAFFSGKNLAESLLSTGNMGKSGIIYGDPLYRPVGVKLFLDDGFPYIGDVNSPYDISGYNPDDLKISANAFYGSRDTRWSLSYCSVLDPKKCTEDNSWQILTESDGPIYEQEIPIDWAALLSSEGLNYLTLRLQIWRQGDKDNSLSNYAYFKQVSQNECEQGQVRCADGIRQVCDNYNDPDYFEWSTESDNSQRAYCNGADINRDGLVDESDKLILDTYYYTTYDGGCYPDNDFCENSDIDKDGIVSSSDAAIYSEYYGRRDCRPVYEVCDNGCLDDDCLCISDEECRDLNSCTTDMCVEGHCAHDVTECYINSHDCEGGVERFCGDFNSNGCGEWATELDNQEVLGCEGFDLDEDGDVDYIDVQIWTTWFGGACSVDNGWCEKSDFDKSGVVDMIDYNLLLPNIGRTDCNGVYIECTEGCVRDQCMESYTCSDTSPCPKDDNLCTDEVCVEGRCTLEYNTAPCDDGLACTENDVCSGGTCSGTQVVCTEDSAECTTTYCDETSGTCIHDATACMCNEQTPCPESDNPCITYDCTLDACAEVFTEEFCDDQDPCTENDICSEGTCQGDTKICSDSLTCTQDTCNPLTGECISTPTDNDQDNFTICEGDLKDCNDNNADINPDALEICNNIDDNCNTEIDEVCDLDKDGYCNSSITYTQSDICSPGDCNDSNPLIMPEPFWETLEKCHDNIDNDCDDLIDDNEPDCLPQTCYDYEYLPGCVTYECDISGTRFKMNNSKCNDSNDCTLDLCTATGCRYEIIEDCQSQTANCEDSDEDGILDYSVDCELGKDICIEKAEDYFKTDTENKKLQLAPIAKRYNLTLNDTQHLYNLTKVNISKTGIAEIIFPKLDITSVNSSGCFTPLVLDTILNITDKKIQLDPASNLNTNATLIFRNVNYRVPALKKDGARCTSCKLVSYSGSVYVANVSGFSTYEVYESYVPPSPNTGSSSSGSSSSGGGSYFIRRTAEETTTPVTQPKKIETPIEVKAEEPRTQTQEPATPQPEVVTSDETLPEEESTLLSFKVIIPILILAIIVAGLLVFIAMKKNADVVNTKSIQPYIQNCRSKGYSDEQIRKALKNSGWDDKTLDKQFRH